MFWMNTDMKQKQEHVCSLVLSCSGTLCHDGRLKNIILNKKGVISDISFKEQCSFIVFKAHRAAVQSRNGIIYLSRDGRHAAAD